MYMLPIPTNILVPGYPYPDLAVALTDANATDESSLQRHAIQCKDISYNPSHSLPYSNPS